MCYTTGNTGMDYTTVEWSDFSKGTFEWALWQMRKGYKVRRSSWTDDSAHLYLRRTATVSNDEIRTVGQDHVGKDTLWRSEKHILAEDWELYVPRCGSCGQRIY